MKLLHRLHSLYLERMRKITPTDATNLRRTNHSTTSCVQAVPVIQVELTRTDLVYLRAAVIAAKVLTEDEQERQVFELLQKRLGE